METENKIIRLFIEEKKPKTIREISKKTGSDYKITHTATQRLINKKVLLSKIIGKSTLCELNTFYYGLDIYKAEDERRKIMLKNKNIRQIYNEIIEKIKSSFFVFIVFGSYSKGKSIKFSDIDLMFISNEKNFEEKISDILSLLPLKIHSLVFTEEEFIKMKDSKKSNVVKEAMKNNVLLYGIENYYKLKNA